VFRAPISDIIGSNTPVARLKGIVRFALKEEKKKEKIYHSIKEI
jgi:hypothetical protein